MTILCNLILCIAPVRRLEKCHGTEVELKTFSQFAFSIVNLLALAEFTEADEAMAELAIADGVFLFLTESVLLSENFCQEEFYIRRTHNLIKDFLEFMPMKVSITV